MLYDIAVPVFLPLRSFEATLNANKTKGTPQRVRESVRRQKLVKHYVASLFLFRCWKFFFVKPFHFVVVPHSEHFLKAVVLSENIWSSRDVVPRGEKIRAREARRRVHRKKREHTAERVYVRQKTVGRVGVHLRLDEGHGWGCRGEGLSEGLSTTFNF